MGGLGSGGWNRRHYGVVEAHRTLDAARLQREGCLTDGWFGSWTWTSSDGDKNSIVVAGGRDAVTLVYRARIGDGDWTAMEERVALDWSPRRFGGAQAYFRCPGCARRVRFLSGAGPRFLCRTCHGLVHASTRERDGDRAMRRARKLRRRIGAEDCLDGAIGLKPKGMHQTTYDRILDDIAAAERAVWDDGLRLLQRIERRVERAALKDRSFWA